MKSKKVYIGISIGAILVICIIVASIFYIKTKNKDVEQADFTKNITNEDTKEAMEITEEKDEAKEITNEVKSEEAVQQSGFGSVRPLLRVFDGYFRGYLVFVAVNPLLSEKRVQLDPSSMRKQSG